MKLVVAMLALTFASLGAACRDDRASTAQTTSHVMIPDPTATDQSNDPNDLALAGEVRRKLVASDRLSMRAKSVVIVVRDGVVTMRGDVASASDHDELVARVVSVPGVVRIDDRTSPADNGE